MKVKLIMNSNDVQAFTDYSIGHSRRILRLIKEKLNKQKHHKVTVEEFSDFIGVSPEVVRKRFE